MKKPWIYLLVVLTAMGTLSHARSDGPESGGGGGVILVGPSHTQPRFIDIYNLPDSRQAQLRRQYSNRRNSQQRVRVKESSADLLNYDPAFIQANQLLTTWFDNVATRRLNIDLQDMLMGPIRWTFTNSWQNYENHYRPTHLPAKKNIYTVAYYLKTEQPEVKILLSLWNGLPLLDQTGLVLHESLRHYQLGLGQSIDDELLQKATVLVLYCPPAEETKGVLYQILGTASPLSTRQKKSLFSSTIATCRD